LQFLPVAHSGLIEQPRGWGASRDGRDFSATSLIAKAEERPACCTAGV